MKVSIAAASVVAGIAASTAATVQSYVIEVSGSGGTTFSGECTVEAGSGEERIALSGSPPWRREVSGTGVRCRLEQTSAGGNLTLSIRRQDGRVSQSASVAGRGSTTQLSVR